MILFMIESEGLASDERVDLKLLARTNLPEFLSNPDLVPALGFRQGIESSEVLVGPLMDPWPTDAPSNLIAQAARYSTELMLGISKYLTGSVIHPIKRSIRGVVN